jgi:hypothetical protein
MTSNTNESYMYLDNTKVAKVILTKKNWKSFVREIRNLWLVFNNGYYH